VVVPAAGHIRGVVLSVGSPLIESSILVEVSSRSLSIWIVTISLVVRIEGMLEALEVSIVKSSLHKLRMCHLYTLLFKNIMKQFLASSDLNCTVLKVFICSYLWSFYHIFTDGFGETFKEEISDFGVSDHISGLIA
jgi:hypothetical protein